MKKFTLSILLVCCTCIAFAQIVPSFQIGLKSGVNLAKFNTKNTFSSDNQVGFYGGAWARIGAAGIHVQPELYVSGKNATLVNDAGQENKVKFTSLDVPVLIGTKIGAAGFGFRLNTGPVVSFILNEDQKFAQAASNVYNGNFKDQAFAWQFGAGLDFGSTSLDLRYELGLSKLNTSGYPETKLNIFTLGFAYKLF